MDGVDLEVRDADMGNRWRPSTSGEHIANKGGENTQEQEEHTHTPHKHAPCMAHREAAEQMQVDREKEQTRTVGVGMAEQPPAVDLAQNVFYGHSGTNHVGREPMPVEPKESVPIVAKRR